MRIELLSKNMVIENIERLIEIDTTIIDEEGTWKLNNFLTDLNHKWENSFLAIIDNQIVGFIICSVKKESLYIHRLAILPEFQGKKIGKQLLDQICNQVIKQKFDTIMLQVKKFNIIAQRFYEINGFERIGSNGPNYIYKKVIKWKI